MRLSKKDGQSGAELLRVSRVGGNHRVKPLFGPSIYNIFWLQADSAGHHLHVFPPGIAADDLPTANGYHVSFREEALLMLECQHFSPFVVQTLTSGGLCATVTARRACADLEAVLSKMAEVAVSGHQNPLVPGLLKVFLVYVSRHFEDIRPDCDSSEENELFSRFMGMVNRESSGRRPVAEYAYALSVSPGTLNNAIKKTSGFTAGYHIQQRIIRHAKQAAIVSHASMKEVAYGLGFQDIAHFSKYFRVNAGMTYSDFKRSFRMV